jgi:hypothetical protein
LHADISDVVLDAFEREVARSQALLQECARPCPVGLPATVDALLLSTTRITTCLGTQAISSATGFFYRCGQTLFLASNRHVFADAAAGHFPDRVDIGVHTDLMDLTRHLRVTLPLYRDGLRLWREATDGAGPVDVAVIEIPPAALPANAVLQAFDETHLDAGDETVAIGDPLSIVGFPLGFHDTVHHLAVARSAAIASAYGVRFQRQGCFLTDARTHRGSSGSPVVRRRATDRSAACAPSWQLLGIHSTRMDIGPRDLAQDESLGLNAAWYADVLVALTRGG